LSSQETLSRFREKAKTFPVEVLDRDLAELSGDIQFLDAQIDVDLGSYKPEQLEKAIEKTTLLKLKAEIIVLELKSREKT